MWAALMQPELSVEATLGLILNTTCGHNWEPERIFGEM
jgi:hypothetical protein